MTVTNGAVSANQPGEGMTMDSMAPAHARTRTMKTWQSRTVATVIIAIALGLAAYSAAADYETVSGQAAKYGVALAGLNPLGILGGLFGITAIDIALTWIGRPIWWLRLFARLFAIGVVAANGSAGWPSPVGTGLRVAAPALFVIITEAGRRTLLRADEEAERERKRRRDERIPRVRWLLDFGGTLALWKRMRLWRIRSYASAVDMELSRLVAIEQLAARYPQGWRQAAPADVVFMLTRGIRMEQVLAKVAELTSPTQPEPAANGGRGSGPKRTAKLAPKKTSGSPRNKTANSPSETQVPKDVDTQAEALLILAAEPGISGSDLGLRLGKTKRYGQILKNKLAAVATSPEE